MPLRFDTLPAFNAVAAAQTAIIDLPAIGRYKHIMLNYTTSAGGGGIQADMEAHLTEIRILVNGKIQRRMTARRLFDIYSYRGIAVTANLIPIFFAEPWRRSARGEDDLAWDMGDVGTFQIEVDIDAAGLNPTLTASAEREASSQRMGAIVKWRNYTVPAAAVGIHNWNTLTKEDSIYAIHCDSTVIDDVEITADGDVRFDATLARNNANLGYNGWTPHADYFHLDMSRNGRHTEALVLRRRGPRGEVFQTKDLSIDFNMSAGTPFTALVESVGERD